jgi:endoglucanase
MQTSGDQFSFDDSHVILLTDALQAVLAAEEPTIFTFEFYPRQPDNVANYTLFV